MILCMYIAPGAPLTRLCAAKCIHMSVQFLSADVPCINVRTHMTPCHCILPLCAWSGCVPGLTGPYLVCLGIKTYPHTPCSDSSYQALCTASPHKRWATTTQCECISRSRTQAQALQQTGWTEYVQSHEPAHCLCLHIIAARQPLPALLLSSHACIAL